MEELRQAEAANRRWTFSKDRKQREMYREAAAFLGITKDALDLRVRQAHLKLSNRLKKINVPESKFVANPPINANTSDEPSYEWSTRMERLSAQIYSDLLAIGVGIEPFAQALGLSPMCFCDFLSRRYIPTAAFLRRVKIGLIIFKRDAPASIADFKKRVVGFDPVQFAQEEVTIVRASENFPRWFEDRTS